MCEKRYYRDFFKGLNLIYFNVCVEETDLNIGAKTNLQSKSLQAVKTIRKKINNYIMENPKFVKSFGPFMCKHDAPKIIQSMCDASEKVAVGPMSAIAGAISEYTGMELLKYSDEIIVENGGDIFIKTNSLRTVGIYAGKSPLSNKIGIEISPEMTPLGICTSAGTIGHSKSFGKADAATVISKDTILADAVATALGNRIKSEGDIESGLNYVSKIEGIIGAIVIINDKMGVWGSIKLVKL